jgi:hypothetical protein
MNSYPITPLQREILEAEMYRVEQAGIALEAAQQRVALAVSTILAGHGEGAAGRFLGISTGEGGESMLAMEMEERAPVLVLEEPEPQAAI